MTTAGQARNAFPAMRIFVFGLEVTEDVLSCTVNMQDGRSPNTCEFVLVSPLDRYIVTERDIHALYDTVNLPEIILPTAAKETFDHSAAQKEIGNLLDVELKARVSRDIQDETKRRILRAKVVERTPNVTQPDINAVSSTTTTPGKFAAMTGDALTYPFQVGDCIFHSNDAVRVFWRDPFKPDDWYFMFTGFITDWTDTVTADNERTVTLRCEDPSRILRYSRFSNNAGQFDSATRQERDNVVNNQANDGFHDLNLEEFMHTILFGSAAAGTVKAKQDSIEAAGKFNLRRVSVNGSTTTPVVEKGAGSFNQSKSAVFRFSPGKDQNDAIVVANNEQIITLAAYQRHIGHKVTSSDLGDLILEGKESEVPGIATGLLRDASGTILTSEIIRIIGDLPHLYPVDNGRLFILTPDVLAASADREILTKDVGGSIATYTTWTTRLKLIYDVCERIDFSFYASPKGDLICEMPLHDFSPQDFGGEGGAVTVPTKDTISWERTFTDERVRTVMIADWSPLDGYAETGGNQETVGSLPGVASIPHLFPQFGVRQERAERRAFIGSEAAATVYANVVLNQMNADARSAHVQMLPKLSLLWPNRPIEFTGDTPDGYAERPYIATTRTITHALVWNSDMSMSVDVNRIRGWAGQVDENRVRLYEPLGGFGGEPLNYAILNQTISPPASTKALSGRDRDDLSRIVEENINPLDISVQRLLSK